MFINFRIIIIIIIIIISGLSTAAWNPEYEGKWYEGIIWYDIRLM